MKTILMLTNFSESARKAVISYLKVHSRLKSDSKFGLLNVYSVPKTGQSQLLKIDDVLERYAWQDLKREKKIIDEIQELGKLDIDLIEGQGDLIKVICQLHEKRPIDLIVLGSKGSNILKQLILGSNTSRLVRLAKTPVLVIPESIDFKKPERIVFATDLKECRFEKHFERLVKIIRFFGAELLILNVYREAKPDARLFEEMMNLYLKNIPHSFHYLQNNDPAAGISGFLTHCRADMLALVERPGNFLVKLFRNSVSNQLALSTETPLLVFHS
ncbi:MAG: universal stress protein [Bacteroidales bacterium]|nr:universal stress protein [Bacteroidales bacterium]